MTGLWIIYYCCYGAGGTNPNERGIVDAYDKEEVEVFELGINTSFLDDRMLASFKILYCSILTKLFQLLQMLNQETLTLIQILRVLREIAYLVTDTVIDFNF